MINNKSTNRLKSIVLDANFKNDSRLWVNPSLFCLKKDEKKIREAISIIDASIKFEDIIIYSNNNAPIMPNKDFVITADGIYSKEHPFLAFSDIKKVKSSTLSALSINDIDYVLTHTKNFNVKNIVKIIQEYITDDDNNNSEPDIDKLKEQANNLNIKKTPFIQKLARGIWIFFFSIILISILINLPELISAKQEINERHKILETKEEQEKLQKQEEKKIIETKLAQYIGQESFDEYNQLMSLSLINYLLKNHTSWTNHIDLYQAKRNFTYKIDNFLLDDVDIKIKKYAYIIYVKDKEEKIIYFGKKYETDMKQLSKNTTLAFQHSNTENFAKFFENLDKRMTKIRNKLSEVKDVDTKILNSKYIEPQERMMKKIRYNLETSATDKFIDSINMGDVLMTLVGIFFILYIISILIKFKSGTLFNVSSKITSTTKDSFNNFKEEKQVKVKKETQQKDKLVGRASVILDSLSSFGNRTFDIIQKADGSFFVRANLGDYDMKADTKSEIEDKVKMYIKNSFGKEKGYKGVKIEDV